MCWRESESDELFGGWEQVVLVGYVRVWSANVCAGLLFLDLFERTTFFCVLLTM